jgi:zinc carboxypeptidase
VRALAVTVLILLGAGAPAARAATCTAHRSIDASIPTWAAVNHFALGSRPATDEEIGAYLAAVASATRRVHTAVAGLSVQGRPIPYAVIASPSTPVDAVEAQLRRLRDGGDSAAQAHAVAAHDPALVWIAGSIHSNEPSGADADMRLLYELAARRDCANARRLNRLIVVLMPVQNPDGRAADTRVNANGFDLNRDWFAATQPETQARLALLQHAPPMLFIDQHEQDGTQFFFPPNADPVNHELPSQALGAIAGVYSPALQHAFAARHYAFETDGVYDLFFPGFGDSGSTLAFGAAGMTFDAPAGLPFARRVDEHFTAASTALDAAAAHEPALLRAWADEWIDAQAQGQAGTLQPNRVIERGDHLQHAVPARTVFAYALDDGPQTHVLLGRLARVGVRYGALSAPLHVAALRAYGSSADAPATLAAGTVIVSLAQPDKHWIETLLDQDAYPPLDRFYDISAWSQPLALGLSGGAIDSRLGAVALSPPTPPPAPAAGAGAYAIDGSSMPGLAAGAALLRDGVPVARDPADGAFVIGPAALSAALAAAAAGDVPVRALSAAPAGAVTLSAPRVAVLADDESVLADPTRTQGQSAAWARFVIATQLGLTIDVLTREEIDAGELTADGDTALVVPDGPTLPSTPDLAQSQALQSWVHAGGTYIGERARGIATAVADGLTTTATESATSGPGALARVDLTRSDPVSWGAGDHVFVTNVGDPIIPGDVTGAAGRYASGAFFVSGDLPGRARYAGTAALVDQRLGSGHVVLFAFDPAFRGDSDGAERLLANALLLAPGG